MVARLRRKATVNWVGSVREGVGKLALASQAAPVMPISLDARKAEAAPSTSPEEMLAASHAACFAMSVRSVLDGAATKISAAANAVVDVEATCVLAIDGTNWKIEESVLSVRISGLTQAQVSDVIETADQRCPISSALRGSVRITKIIAGAAQ